MTTSLAVLMTCHNRSNQTLRCMASLMALVNGEWDLSVFLVDDGSTDGTADLVREAYPHVNIIQGNGSLYWCGGMERAWQAALAQGYDGYLWLNDDVDLQYDALESLQRAVKQLRELHQWPAVLVGSTYDPVTSEHTYGGYRLENDWHPGRVVPVMPSETAPVPVDTFNGNFVFVPQDVVNVVGTLDSFTHAIGDWDYGLRVRQAGMPIYLMPGYVGRCVRSSQSPLTLSSINSPKGLPWRDWLRYTQRHGAGPAWPLIFAAPYVKATVRAIFSLMTRPRATGGLR